MVSKADMTLNTGTAESSVAAFAQHTLPINAILIDTALILRANKFRTTKD